MAVFYIHSGMSEKANFPFCFPFWRNVSKIGKQVLFFFLTDKALWISLSNELCIRQIYTHQFKVLTKHNIQDKAITILVYYFHAT